MGDAAVLQRVRKRLARRRVRQIRLVTIDFREPGLEMDVTGILRRKERLHRPVFDGGECLDFTLAFNNQPKRDRLDAPRARVLLDASPKHRAHLVSNDAVQDTTRLLRVDKGHLHYARIFKGIRNRRPRDFMVRNAMELPLRRTLQEILKVPCNRLALAVRVSRQVDVVSLGGRLLQGGNHLPTIRGDDILGLEIVGKVDTQ